MKKAFTLVELLVVIAIIGALSAVLVPYIGNAMERARNVKCEANLSNLAKAVQQYASDKRRYPPAGSLEVQSLDFSRGNGKEKHLYDERPGWISWNSAGAYESEPRNTIASAGWFLSAYSTDREARTYSLTNGAIWKATQGNAAIYVCPCHTRKCGKGDKGPAWSYVMNERFGADVEAKPHPATSFPHIDFHDGKTYGNFDPKKTLLFAELQWEDFTNDKPDYSTASGPKNDRTLQYRHGQRENIGYNHRDGKRIFAHIVYADAHVEKLDWYPGQNQQDLTEWLCEGEDIQVNPSAKRYEKID